MKLKDLNFDDIKDGAKYAVFKSNKLIQIVNYVKSHKLFRESHYWQNYLEKGDQELDFYPLSDIKPPVWETRPDGMQILNYENRTLLETEEVQGVIQTGLKANKINIVKNNCPPNCGCYHVCQGHGGSKA